MRVPSKLMLVLGKLYLREPIGAFFTLLYAPILVVLLGVVFGNKPDPAWGGLGFVDANLPAYAAIAATMVGLLTIPISTVGRRESGALRRFMATPLRPLVFIFADASVYFVMTLLGVFLALVVGIAGFGARPAGSIVALIGAACLGSLSFLALGYMLASLMPTLRTAQVLGNLLIFPMMIFSGATVPLKVMPQAVQNVARFFPLTHFVGLMRGAWLGDAWIDHWVEAAVLVGMLLVGVAIAAWRFRWE